MLIPISVPAGFISIFLLSFNLIFIFTFLPTETLSLPLSFSLLSLASSQTHTLVWSWKSPAL